VTAVVEADGKLYSAAKSVKVTAGGCGGWFNHYYYSIIEFLIT
jgi:hypothetical protein